jgi:predicted RNase H-related nuclease YkuK (DUF458 family)
MQKQWTEMTQDEKLEYLRDRVQKTDARIFQITSGTESQIMRVDKCIDKLKKLVE